MEDCVVDEADAALRIRLVVIYDRELLGDEQALRWRLVALNGRSLGSSAETFTTVEAALADFELHSQSVNKLSITLAHRARHGHWTWALQDPTGRLIAQADRVYERRASCSKAANRMVVAISNHRVVGSRGRRNVGRR